MKTIKFVGQINTVTPVVVSLPSVTGIPKNAQGQHYIPATSIRGMLRSTGAFAISHLLNANGKNLSIDDIYMNFSGVDTGRKIKLGGGYETLGKNLNIRKTNPLISLFGNFALAGQLKMGNAFCIANTDPISTYGNGSRNHPFNRNPNLFNFVPEDDLVYLKAIMDADALTSLETSDLKAQKTKLKLQLRSADAEEKKEIFAKMDKIDNEIRDAKDARTGSSESILRPLDGFEAIDPNCELQHRFTLTNPTDDELNLLLWILYKASSNFNIGGHQNIGCGEIHGSWEIKQSSFDEPKPQTIGTLTIDDDGFNLQGLMFDPKAIDNAIIDGTFDFSKY